jgi:transposase
MVAPVAGMRSQEVKFARFEAGPSDMVEIVIGHAVIRIGSDIESERLAAVIGAVRQA